MTLRTFETDIRPRILYHVAKAAWLGQLLERREELCEMVQQEFQDKATRRQVANQIRIAMGLDPHDDDIVLYEHDKEALMGMANEPVVVANPAACANCQSEDRECEKACTQGAISHQADGRLVIDYKRCLGEGDCISACSFGALSEKSQFVPLINLLKQKSHPVYASIAPAFAGQFGAEVTPGKLRTALKRLGFEDMVETALAADLVTMKEAFEFNDHVQVADDFLITSCCCPVWIKLIENKFPELLTHISPSVSPMIASARIIKTLTPEAKVVFIGPCVAKKSEALLPDLKGAIDFVLTFQELNTIFEAAEVNPASMPDEENAQASWAGRVYARTGGVSDAVSRTLDKLVPLRAQSFLPLQVDGIPACQKVLAEISKAKPDANFIEGMACKGGCVGGPARILPPEITTAHVNSYGDSSHAPTPVENPHVYAILAHFDSDNANVPTLTGEGPIASLLARKLYP